MPAKPRIDPRVATARRVEVVPIDTLREWDRNPHEGSDPDLQASLARFGQVKPIVRAPDGWIIAGNTTLRAMLAEGFTHAAVVTLDAPEAEQIAYGLADNRIGALGEDNDAVILELLKQIDVLDGTGWTEDDMTDLIAILEEADRDANAGAPPPTSIKNDEGVAKGEPTLADRLADYANKTVRSIVIDLDLPAFAWWTEHAERARELRGVDTNAALVVGLIADLLGVDAPQVD